VPTILTTIPTIFYRPTTLKTQPLNLPLPSQNQPFKAFGFPNIIKQNREKVLKINTLFD
jgi:hypothetical protein